MPAASVAVLSFSGLPSKDPVGVLSLDWAHLPTRGLDNRDGTRVTGGQSVGGAVTPLE